ncbi:bifunctional diaminohydroxyphosphoribosylaminopyrimidine deaminase/5-amino-6-(5-phosphoribosylamino)uracil reductase RibD [Elongatibacter sediminis]|uniref:Riboflavin biosynthesis protein RibD n=1 Tax=Elongatibacter sediminis TaxID=3119006 RepID=A0AAW9RAI1_9GAMM
MSFSAFDHASMSQALRLAALGMNTTRPNPRVGCVLAVRNEVVAEGWHEVAGGPHAEVAALDKAGPAARGSTAYVTLEPCSHHGRTPPCADRLIEAGIERVVVASVDPNHAVNGTGLERLRAAGIAVQTGLLGDQAEALNAGFFKRMRSGRPWLRVKAAISLDGRTGLSNGDSKWITSAASRRDVQAWRARSCAMLTGLGTVMADNPSLTARVEDPPLRPLRVIADSHWRTPPGSRVLDDPGTALIAGLADSAIPPELADTGVTCLPLPGSVDGVDLGALLDGLGERGINEVQVEAGARLCGSLLRGGFVDEVLVYLAPVLLGEGGPGPFALGELESMAGRTYLEVIETCAVGPDLRLRLTPGTGESADAAGDE